MSQSEGRAGRAVVAGASLSWCGTTSTGRVRPLNEDALLAEPPVFAVADGMGGHDAGEVASALTVERLRALAMGDDVTMESVEAELQEVNSLLRDASPDPDEAMGTTGVGLVVLTGGATPSWLVFNVGDSRAYCLDDEGLHQLSRDHSYVQDLVEAGRLSREGADRHPHRHVITRALGIGPVVEVDYWVRPVRPGERYLLCSDGLPGEVDEDEIRALLRDRPTPEAAASALVERAVDAGGRDNVTAVVVDVTDVAGWDDTTTAERGHGAPHERTVRRPPPPAPPAEGSGC